MLYIKVNLSDDVVLTAPIYDDEIYTKCPECGVEHAVDPKTIAQIINGGGDFIGTTVYCDRCSNQRRDPHVLV